MRPVPEEKEALIDRISEILGFVPAETRLVLRILAHPDVIIHTNEYFNSLDKSTMCLTYENPWSCALEAEAKYKNIRYGWFGGGGGIGFDESWCENCRRKVVGDVLEDREVNTAWELEELRRM